MPHVVLVKSRLNHLGGLEKYALDLANAFVEEGFSVTLLTTGSSFIHKEIQTVSLNVPYLFSFLFISNFQKACLHWLKSNPHDFVFSLDRVAPSTYYRAGNGAHYFFLKQKNTTLRRKLTSWFSFKDRLILKIEQNLFTHPNLKRVIANSNWVKEQLCEKYRINPSKIGVVYNGVDFSQYALSKAPCAPFTQKNPLKLLFVGQDFKRKGLDYVLSSLAPIKGQNWTLDVIGKDKNSKSYQKKIQKLGLERQVFLQGPCPSKPFFESSHVFLLPTFYDPFASATLEALASGLYVITSSSNGAKEVLDPNCGLVLSGLNAPCLLTSKLSEILNLKFSLPSKDKVRESIAHLDRKKQLHQIIQDTLTHA